MVRADPRRAEAPAGRASGGRPADPGVPRRRPRRRARRSSRPAGVEVGGALRDALRARCRAERAGPSAPSALRADSRRAGREPGGPQGLLGRRHGAARGLRPLLEQDRLARVRVALRRPQRRLDGAVGQVELVELEAAEAQPRSRGRAGARPRPAPGPGRRAVARPAVVQHRRARVQRLGGVGVDLARPVGLLRAPRRSAPRPAAPARARRRAPRARAATPPTRTARR